MTSTSFEIENPVFLESGGISTSASFQHISSTGELTIGEVSATNFVGQLGWLYFPAVTEDEDEDDGSAESGGGGSSGGFVFPYFPGLDPDFVPPPVPEGECKPADFDCDGLIDIADLSILLYYAKFAEDTGEVIAYYDLSQDGEIDIRDISIMFYYWDE